MSRPDKADFLGAEAIRVANRMIAATPDCNPMQHTLGAVAIIGMAAMNCPGMDVSGDIGRALLSVSKSLGNRKKN